MTSIFLAHTHAYKINPPLPHSQYSTPRTPKKSSYSSAGSPSSCLSAALLTATGSSSSAILALGSGRSRLPFPMRLALRRDAERLGPRRRIAKLRSRDGKRGVLRLISVTSFTESRSSHTILPASVFTWCCYTRELSTMVNELI